MGIIKERFKAKADASNAEIKELLKENGNKVIGEVTLAQVYQGMRGITGLVSETSLLDSQEGIRFRGYSIPELQAKLPKAKDGTEPLPEGLFYLMLIGELPTEDDAHHVTSVWQRRSHVPNHVFATIDALPVSTHPHDHVYRGYYGTSNRKQFCEGICKRIKQKRLLECGI